MLHRQRVVLNLLARLPEPVTTSALSKLVFLLRYETDVAKLMNFYDFVLSEHGSHSFTLEREIVLLSEKGYVRIENHGTHIRPREEVGIERGGTGGPANCALDWFVGRYAEKSTAYVERTVEGLTSNPLPIRQPTRAVYTAGYEGRSVDAFLNNLLAHGIAELIDVRANPISRKYGFHKSRLRQFCGRLGIIYTHLPALGISSSVRANLSGKQSHKRLLYEYEVTMLPAKTREVDQLASRIQSRTCALMCMEARPEDCHRGKLARELSARTGYQIEHI
ncbi:MAG: DUF488 domain-containing protein [Bacteroidota bacterium]|nr:DUF488 domain-containing protein [Bacteroidota bacterium]